MRVWDAPAVIEVLDNATASAFTEKFVLRALLALYGKYDSRIGNFLTSCAQWAKRTESLTERQTLSVANALRRSWVEDLVAIANTPKVESPAPKAYIDAATATTMRAGIVKSAKIRKPRKLRTISKDAQNVRWQQFLDEQEAAFMKVFDAFDEGIKLTA